MVVSTPAGVHWTASVLPELWPLTVTSAVPATSWPGASSSLGGSEHPASAVIATAANTTRYRTVQNLRRDGAEFSSSERLVGARFSSSERLVGARFSSSERLVGAALQR